MSMKVGENIFVYGTLKQGHGANSMLQNRSEFVGDTRISGKLYGLGGFPGLKTIVDERDDGIIPFVSEGPCVTGELYRITDEDLPFILDRYEGYPSLYSRRRVEAEDGNVTWVYEYNGDPRPDAIVPSGNWG